MIHQISQALTPTKVNGKRCFQSDGVDLHDSISVDNNTQVSEVPTDRDIVASMRGAAVMDN
jgi:hypothetical protein